MDQSGLAGQRIAQLQAELTEARAAAASAVQTVQEVHQQLESQQDEAARELERVQVEAATSVRQAAEHSSQQLESVRCVGSTKSSLCSVDRSAKDIFRWFLAVQDFRLLQLHLREERRRAEARARALLKRLATGDTKLRRELSLIKLRLDGVRLGNIAYRRNGPLGAPPVHCCA